MSISLPGVNITNVDGGMKKTGGGIGAIALIGKGATVDQQKKVVPIVSAKDAEKFGNGSVKRAAKRIFDMGAAVELYGYALPEGANAADYLAGVDALIADNTVKECIAVLDETDNAFWASLASKIEGAVSKDRYMYALAQVRLPNDGEGTSNYATALVSARGSVYSERLAICVGSVNILQKDGTVISQPLIDTVLGSIAQRNAWENIEAVKFGALKNVASVGQEFNNSELAALLNKGYITVRKLYGRTGVYITLARLATTETSDYDTLSKIRVINRASTLVRDAQLHYLNDTLPANNAGASLLKKASEIPLEAMKNNREITSFSVDVDISKLLSDREIKSEIKIIPLGTSSVINTTIKYVVEV